MSNLNELEGTIPGLVPLDRIRRKTSKSRATFIGYLGPKYPGREHYLWIISDSGTVQPGGAQVYDPIPIDPREWEKLPDGASDPPSKGRATAMKKAQEEINRRASIPPDDAIGYVKKHGDRLRGVAHQVSHVAKDFELMSAIWRIEGMHRALADGVLEDWVIHREDEEDDIHNSVLDVCAVLPLGERLQFDPAALQAAVRERFHSAYGTDA